jgi:hypothetical protein
MIGILLLIYFAGRSFYNLAGQHNKNQWAFAILGVVSYYAGIFTGGIIIGIVLELYAPGAVDTMNETVLSLMTIPVGILTCWLTYTLLKRNWSKPTEIERNTLDADIMKQNNEQRYLK